MSIEEHEHLKVCKYLRYQYPKVLFNTDLSGIKLTIGQAKKVKELRSEKSWPDIFIAESHSGYHGLFIEMKSPEIKIRNKKGNYSTPHIKEQAEFMKKLHEKGYFVLFACGFDQARSIIDCYLNDKLK